MKKLLLLAGLLWSAVASAQFVPGQLLTAAELNAQFVLYAPLAGATFTGPVALTDLSSSGTVSGVGFTNLLSPYLLSATASTIYAPITGSVNYAPATGSSVYATIANLALKAPIADPTFTGTVTIPSGASISGFAPLVSPIFTGTPAAPTASATTNTTQLASTAMVNSAITGGSLAGSFTTLASTGNFTPSQTNGIVGTTTNNNANAGSVGEYVTATTLGTSIVAGTPYNAASISLTAGDWDVSGTISFINSAAANSSVMNASISQTTATQNATIGFMSSSPNATAVATTTRLPTPVARISLSAPATIFLVGVDAFAGGTVTSDGLIRARRVR